MSIVITNNRHYSDIAEAIRTIGGSSTTYSPSQMSSAILSLTGTTILTATRIIVNAETGGYVTATKGSITKNAVYYNGQYVVFNCDVGTWTVSFYKNGETSETTVTIPSDQQRFEYTVTL